jgi:hypothetical protein
MVIYLYDCIFHVSMFTIWIALRMLYVIRFDGRKGYDLYDGVELWNLKIR